MLKLVIEQHEDAASASVEGVLHQRQLASVVVAELLRSGFENAPEQAQRRVGAERLR